MNVKSTENRQNGSALLMALLIGLVLSVTLGSYLYLVVDERTLASRSLAWNSAIPVAEAGVEEALTQLYYANTNNFATNGWTLGADGMYHKTRALSPGNYYGTAIQLAANPIIWSTGCVSAPFAGTNAYIRRLLKITTSKAPSFGGGITAKGAILFSGGAGANSFNGANGPYNLATATSNITVLTDSSAAGAIALNGGSTINGTAITGPGGTVTGATSSTATRNDANVQINDPPLPADFSDGNYSIVLPRNVTVGGTNYPYAVGTGNYEVANLNIGNNPMVVNGNAVIYCTQTGNNVVNISGSGFIYLTPGSSLTIYTAGNIVISGSGVVNGTQRASDCFIYGLPTCTSAVYSGSSVFYGVVDVPEAAFTFSGAAGACGAFTANTVTVQGGTANVHSDTSLGGTQGYIVQSWNEIAGH